MIDATERVTLSRQYELSTGKTDTLTLREPTTLDVARSLEHVARITDSELKEFEKERYLIALLSDVAPKDLDSMGYCDYERLQCALLFLRTQPEDREHARQSILGKLDNLTSPNLTEH